MDIPTRSEVYKAFEDMELMSSLSLRVNLQKMGYSIEKAREGITQAKNNGELEEVGRGLLARAHAFAEAEEVH
ncbi:MAG TPA: hypothetical protein VFM46_14130 [Pseudomonadales bacterium]|nr:hypothetical protein [Pseudomonadales bacterium]